MINGWCFCGMMGKPVHEAQYWNNDEMLHKISRQDGEEFTQFAARVKRYSSEMSIPNVR